MYELLVGFSTAWIWVESWNIGDRLGLFFSSHIIIPARCGDYEESNQKARTKWSWSHLTFFYRICIVVLVQAGKDKGKWSRRIRLACQLLSWGWQGDLGPTGTASQPLDTLSLVLVKECSAPTEYLLSRNMDSLLLASCKEGFCWKPISFHLSLPQCFQFLAPAPSMSFVMQSSCISLQKIKLRQ